ncbi:MAG: four helix bundle protein [Candidatus Marinimicrobia bacterium]|nr:four helix bundle protein [Candidatus Neomarinimicrobiota bacterium]MBL7047573.1 four helix bundle protein [Candidatus Neomarinimicrobiota bacterium]
MKEETKKLLKRTFNFGVNCLLFLNNLPNQEKFRVPKYQLAKSSTSIGSNYEEAQAGESKKDFIHKIGIVLKETRESNFWLRVIEVVSKEDKNIDTITLKKLITESVEFKKIFTTIKINSQKND